MGAILHAPLNCIFDIYLKDYRFKFGIFKRRIVSNPSRIENSLGKTNINIVFAFL